MTWTVRARHKGHDTTAARGALRRHGLPSGRCPGRQRPARREQADQPPAAASPAGDPRPLRQSSSSRPAAQSHRGLSPQERALARDRRNRPRRAACGERSCGSRGASGRGVDVRRRHPATAVERAAPAAEVQHADVTAPRSTRPVAGRSRLPGEPPSSTAVKGLRMPPADRTARPAPDAPAAWQLDARCGSGTDVKPPFPEARRLSEYLGYVRLMTRFLARLRPAVTQAGILGFGRVR